jgi:ribonuclease VapC
VNGVVVDTSALVAIVLGEPDAEVFGSVLKQAAPIAVSVVSIVEATMVVESRGGLDATRDLTLLLDSIRVIKAHVDTEQLNLAVGAWRRFGKGRHPAALNFGDCFSYALASARNAPLLFKGHDFDQTDVASAIA